MIRWFWVQVPGGVPLQSRLNTGKAGYPGVRSRPDWLDESNGFSNGTAGERLDSAAYRPQSEPLTRSFVWSACGVCLRRS